MVDGSGLVIDVLGLATTNDACSKPNPLLTADSGALIEGFMVLADVTGDSSWRIRYACQPPSSNFLLLILMCAGRCAH